MAAELFLQADTTYGNYGILRPVTVVGTRNIGIIWATGWIQTTQNMLKDIFGGGPSAQPKLVWWLASRYTVLVTQRGLDNDPANTWGNSTGVAAIEDAYQVLISLGCATKVGLVGWSGGQSDVSQWAAANPSKVRGIASIIGATNLQDIRDLWTAPILGLDARAAIDAAWGVTYPAPLPAGAEPYQQITAISGLAQATAWIGSADTVVGPGGATQWATAAGGTVHVVPGAGHDDAVANTIDRDEFSRLFI